MLIFTFGISRITTDVHGIKNDEIEADLLMTQALPEILPIKGQRIKFYYPGIRTLCLRCYKSGHPKWECSQQFKTNWLEYVLKFYNADVVSDEMLGSWVDTLKTFHPEFQKVKPVWSAQNDDLRDNLKAHRKQVKKTNGLYQLNQNPQRGRGNHSRSNPNQANKQNQYRGQNSRTENQDWVQPNRKATSYRGRGRGSFRGRGRGQNYNPNLSQSFGNRRGQFYSDVPNNLY